jgi:putative ABC transport system substrate-binding protein
MQDNRRNLLKTLLLSPLFCDKALAQNKPYTVMIITFRGLTTAEQGFMGFLNLRLKVDFLIRDVQGNRSLIRNFISEAKAKKVNLIYTFGTSVTLDVVGALGKIDPDVHLTDIPVVFNIVADPVGAGLASSFSATGRNLTGVSHIVPIPDQLRLMNRFRNTQKLAVIYNSFEANSLSTIDQLRQNASIFKFDLIEAPLMSGQKPNLDEIINMMDYLISKHPDFVYLPSDSSIIERASQIVEIAHKAHIPTISATEDPIRNDGAILGLVSNYYNAGAFAGYKAEKILQGLENIENIAIETLQRFALLVNMKSSIRLELYPPLDLIKIAEII